MSFQYVYVFVITVGAVLNVIAQNNVDEPCGIQSSVNQDPWLVGIEFKTNQDLIKRLQCTGALVSRSHVVSSARCFDNLYRGQPNKSINPGSNITIIAGDCVGDTSSNWCTDDYSLRIPIDVVIIHPQYDASVFWLFEATSFYDMALIRLREMVPYTDFIRPICLPSSDVTRLADTDRELYVTGLKPPIPHSKLHAAVTYMNKADCGRNILAEDEVCATDAGTITTCLNQGGLVMNKRGDRYELVGILTYRSRCNPPRVFINLSLHLEWLRSDMTRWAGYSGVGCGRRKVDSTELIFNGEATKAGDWPWHIAIYRQKASNIEYICGGTLISKTVVLTAAHCVTEQGIPVNPEILSVILGKYNLIGRDVEAQERVVFAVISHENFSPTKFFNNDIALLKLRTEATYTEYVQPACIWSSEAQQRLPQDSDFGTVVGWGIDQSEQLSSQIKRSHMPRVSDMTCIRINPLFYTNVLKNDKKFCAGWANGTSPCNGDSGGGFLVFVPDTANADSSDAMGAWYVRGIVSMTGYLRNKGRCDPYQYVVFTDVDKYTTWIQKHID